jgi:predicted dehydrogenase
MTPRIDRRAFLQNSAALAAAVGTAGVTTTRAEEPQRGEGAKVAGPNDVIRVAVIGVRGRGMSHVQGFSEQPDARIVAICDADTNVIGRAMKASTSRYGSEPKFYQDVRKLIEDKDVDAISIATPNHWHSLMTIWGCQAGKDVYVEKPGSHNVFEGRKMVEAARKYNRIVQHGAQCRSNQGMKDAMAFVQSGQLGNVYLARGLCYRDRPSIGFKEDGPVPAGLDYDLWCGPAEKLPFNENRLHYNWHWFWNTGNGDLGNQGIHQVDLARWGLNKNELPKRVLASGGRIGYKDQAETPNTLTVHWEYDDGVQFEFAVRGLPTNDELGAKVGVLFFGTEGVLAITSYTDWQTYLGRRMEKGPGGRGGGDHFRNFLDAVKSRDPQILNADIEQGHISCAYMHMGNIAYRLGRKLHINPSTESFVNDSEADAMLTRNYRKPFVVPESV